MLARMMLNARNNTPYKELAKQVYGSLNPPTWLAGIIICVFFLLTGEDPWGLTYIPSVPEDLGSIECAECIPSEVYVIQLVSPVHVKSWEPGLFGRR